MDRKKNIPLLMELLLIALSREKREFKKQSKKNSDIALKNAELKRKRRLARNVNNQKRNEDYNRAQV